MSKTILFDLQASKKLKSGVDKLAKAVKITLGPNGRPVIIGKQYGSPHITKDGVTVSKAVELKDPIENIGATLVKEVASKTNDDAGDGTTTATVLAQAILNEGQKNITAGANPTDIVRGIEKAVQHVTKHLKQQAKAITSKEELKQVATISANNDANIGTIIADAMEKVGDNGVITVEEAKGTETEVSIVEGMQFNSGYRSPHFVTNPEKMTAEFENAYIFITDQKITTFHTIIKLVESVAKSGRPLILISEDVENELLAGLIINAARGIIKSCAIKAPGFGENRKAKLEDIAILTGATVISQDRGHKLENTTLEHLGSAKKIKIDKDNTTIIGGSGNQKTIDARIKKLQIQIEQSTSDYDKEKLQERLAKLSQGVAVIRVGAKTETEAKENKDRMDDALNATKAAVQGGYLPGGGVALLRAAKELDNLASANQDEQIGITIIQKAIAKPLYTILENAVGVDKIYPIMDKIQQGTADYGYNLRTHTFGSLIQLGVIEPAKVPICALSNAASISKLMSGAGCVIADEPKKEKATPPMGGHGSSMPGMM